MATTSQKIILSDNIRLLVAAGVGDKMSVPDQILRSYPRSSYTSTKNRRACNKDTPGPDVNNEVQGLTDIERTIPRPTHSDQCKDQFQLKPMRMDLSLPRTDQH